MKRTLLICLLLLAAIQVTKAQLNIITGVVLDPKGNPVHDVFVADRQHQNATFSDSLGNFSIAVQADSKLQFERAGYKDTVITSIKPGMQVAMSAESLDSPGSLATNSPGQGQLGSLTRNEVARMSNDVGGYLKPSHEKGDTRGSQYLFETFVHGYMVNSSGEIVNKPNYLFDYDKMNGNLLLTRDNKTMIIADQSQAKSFSLFSNADQRVDFEEVPAIDNSHYFQILATGKKYKICKLLKTRFARADYVNNGAAPHGHDYDEYIDEPDYYVLDIQANQAQKFSPKKKSIKEVFAKEADKVSKFLADNSGRIDDAYLGKLGAYMNQ
jgi:hypothetical protein